MPKTIQSTIPKTKEAYRTAALCYLAERAPETFREILCAEQIEAEVERIELDTQIFNRMSLKILTDDPKSKLTFLIGETKRLKSDEDLKYLTERGGMRSSNGRKGNLQGKIV